MSTISKTLRYLLLSLFLLLVASLFLVSYSSAWYMILGISIAWLVIFIVSNILKIRRIWLRVLSIIGVLSCSFAVAVVLIYYNLSFFPTAVIFCSPGQTTLQNTLTKYRMTIEPVDSSVGHFKVSEDVTYDVESHLCNSDYTTSISVVEKDATIQLPERQIYSSKRGLFIREIRITPLDESTLSGEKSTCCSGISMVELRDFPRNSFYEARYVQNAEISSYLDTETVRWDLRGLNDDIVFAYVASPFNVLRGFLSPLINISYQSQWLIALVGLIVSSVITPIVKPVLVDLGKSKLKSVFEKKRVKRDQQPYLYIRQGEMVGKTISVPPEGLTIGRGFGCQIKLQEQSISRSHATILSTARGFCLRDDGSSLGTFLNGQRVPHHELWPLKHGDVIGMGYHQLFEFRME